jgi:hypothetical protein
MGTADYEDAGTVNVADAVLSPDEGVEFHQALCCMRTAGITVSGAHWAWYSKLERKITGIVLQW